ncbi:hypothetical protein Acr_06g0012030 [Actinidia rufa]|uniref:Retroviral polymerase SH3-like domain-containing protein n=1 Tax=Actinidia rufa TaxID=165716 RepID=A0A7J0ES53_9ERIC|nr:hypothetical protein Acr_06g0012030 [Actinidia rufa]
MDMTRCLLHDKGLPKKFWVEALNTTVFLLNKLPIKTLYKKTPFETWYSYKPKLLNLKTFGCLCFSYIPQIKRDKLDKKAEPGIFVGYSLVSKAYKIYLPQSNKVIVSRDVHFSELDNWSWENDKKLEFQGENDDVDEEHIKGTRSLSDIYQRCNIAVMELARYEEAATDQKWIVVMKEELKMIKKNQTWELVDRPKHKKAIGVKWDYRTKLNADGSVNKYKAREPGLSIRGQKVYTIFIVLIFSVLRETNVSSVLEGLPHWCSDVRGLAVLCWKKDVGEIYNALGRRRIFLKKTAFAGLDL